MFEYMKYIIWTEYTFYKLELSDVYKIIYEDKILKILN